ncbi:MAG: CapA family protein [Ilumatobacteraceae bacterium]
MKRRFRHSTTGGALGGLLVAAALASACGDSGSSGEGATTPTSSATTTSALPPIQVATTTTIPATYVLQAGDSPSLVADHFGLSVEALEAANAGNENYYRFLVGAEINLTPPPTTVPPSTVAAASTLPPTTPAPVSGRVTMAFSGDVLAHRAVNRAAAQADGTYDYRAMFANIAPLVSGVDLAICHLESPVTPDDEVLVPPPLLAVDEAIGPALAGAGYDRCSTASNHALDHGAAGVEATIAALAAAGMGQSGMADGPDAVLPPILEINGVRAAHLSYAFGFDVGNPPADQPWLANRIDTDRIIRDARAERELGAEAVIVSLHWGAAQVVQPTADQRRVAEVLTASGAVDLIVGHHAHVLQPIEQVNGVWVVWGMGNVLSNHPTSDEWPPSTQDGVVVTVALQRNQDGSIVVETPVAYPTWCDKEHGYVIRLTTEVDDLTLTASVREQLRRSQQRSSKVLGPYLAG